MNFQIKQFEGPLDLLLHLIKKQKMDIFDINIHQITTQYLDYIQNMRDLNFSVASDFIVMSATLLQIKARMLLKLETESDAEEEGVDPRQELAQRLFEYEKFKKASIQIYEKDCLGRNSFTRPVYKGLEIELIVDPEADEVMTPKSGVFGLGKMYVQMQAQIERDRFKYVVTKPMQSITQRIKELLPSLSVKTPRSFFSFLGLSKLMQKSESQNQIIVTLLASLELAKQGYVQITQSRNFGDIFLSLKKAVQFKDLKLDQVEKDFSSQVHLDLDKDVNV